MIYGLQNFAGNRGCWGDGRSYKEIAAGRGAAAAIARSEEQVTDRSGSWPPSTEQFPDPLPGNMDHELVEGGVQVRVVALARGTEEPVLVQPDQGADGQVLGSLVPPLSALEIAGSEAMLREHGLTLSAVEGEQVLAHDPPPSVSTMR
jgi:hypothetical protein